MSRPRCFMEAQRTLFIVQRDDRRAIKFNDEAYGPYKSKGEAMLFAIDAARKLGEYGGNPEVVLLGEGGHFHTEWSYGRDAAPASAVTGTSG